MTAYVLLAYLSQPSVSPADLGTAAQIVRWLCKQQNPYGGFASTQVPPRAPGAARTGPSRGPRSGLTPALSPCSGHRGGPASPGQIRCSDLRQKRGLEGDGDIALGDSRGLCAGQQHPAGAAASGAARAAGHLRPASPRPGLCSGAGGHRLASLSLSPGPVPSWPHLGLSPR